MNDNLMRARSKVIDGWPMLVAFALYWLALVIFAMTLASGIFVI
jgi:hypothetical protein